MKKKVAINLASNNSSVVIFCFSGKIRMELELPSAIKLTQMCGLQPETAQQFTDVRESGAAFQKYFMDAWKVAK